MTTYKTRFIEPYKADKKSTNLPHLSIDKKQAGVYLIKSKRSGKIVYVGFSENQLYKTIYRHFQKWTDIQRAIKTRFTYSKDGYTIRVIFTTPSRAALLEKHLITKLLPRDNKMKYDQYLSDAQQLKAEQIINNSMFINSSDEYPF